LIRNRLQALFLLATLAALVLAACGNPTAPPTATLSAATITPAVLPPTLAPTETGVPASPSPPVAQTEALSETPTETPGEKATPSPEPQPPVPAGSSCDPAYVSPFGIDMYHVISDAEGLPEMQAAGSRFVTTMLRWSDIEPSAPVNGKSTRNWESFDTKVRNAREAGMELFVLFTANPLWAGPYEGGPVNDPQVLIDFVTAAVERYDGDGKEDAPGSPAIRYWSFYAEPDNQDLWYAQHGKGYWGHDGAGYARLFTQLTPAIHAANPEAKVLMGGLGYDYFTTEGGPFNRDFLPSVLSALSTYPGGAPAYLDAVGFHFYPISAQRWPTIGDKAQEIRGIMEQYGAGSLPLVVPEMGYWSDTAVGSSEGWQAEYLVQMFTTGLAAGIEQLSWFKVFDEGTGSEMHGLFRGHDLAAPKPSYTAYATMTAELDGARYLRELTLPGLSGHVFSTCDSPEKVVVWGHVANGSVPINQGCVRRVDLLGNAVALADGAAEDLDGAANGQVLVGVTGDDLFYLGNCR
jgi:hypothetical protein